MSVELMMPSNHLLTPFSSCPQSFPALGSFPVSQLFSSGGQRIGASASASVLSINIQGWFPLRLTGLISLQSKGLSRVFSNTTKIRVSNFSWKIRGWSASNLWSSTSTGPLDLRSRCPAGERYSLIFQCLPTTFQYIWQPGSLVSLGGLQIHWPLQSHGTPSQMRRGSEVESGQVGDVRQSLESGTKNAKMLTVVVFYLLLFYAFQKLCNKHFLCNEKKKEFRKTARKNLK